jgi:hypothetical protein
MCAVMLDTKGLFECTVKRNAATPRSPSATAAAARPPAGAHRTSAGGTVGVGGPCPLTIEADQTVTLSADPAAEWTPEQPEARTHAHTRTRACRKSPRKRIARSITR